MSAEKMISHSQYPTKLTTKTIAIATATVNTRWRKQPV
jgi:hypothetical protein